MPHSSTSLTTGNESDCTETTKFQSEEEDDTVSEVNISFRESHLVNGGDLSYFLWDLKLPKKHDKFLCAVPET